MIQMKHPYLDWESSRGRQLVVTLMGGDKPVTSELHE